MIRCPKCMTLIEEAEKTCPDCKADLSGSDEPKGAEAMQAGWTPKKWAGGDAKRPPAFRMVDSWDAPPVMARPRRGFLKLAAFLAAASLMAGGLYALAVRSQRIEARKRAEAERAAARLEKEAKLRALGVLPQAGAGVLPPEFGSIVVDTRTVVATPGGAAPGGPDPAASSLADWVFRGAVRDIITGDPVAAVRVTLTDEQGQRYDAFSRSNGSYKVKVKVPQSTGRGYEFRISHPGYIARFHVRLPEEAGRPEEEERLRIARDLYRTMSLPEPVTGRGAVNKVDLYVLPTGWSP